MREFCSVLFCIEPRGIDVKWRKFSTAVSLYLVEDALKILKRVSRHPQPTKAGSCSYFCKRDSQHSQCERQGIFLQIYVANNRKLP